jgi:hypothetical protein
LGETASERLDTLDFRQSIQPIWTVRRFDLTLNSPEAKEISDCSYEFARGTIDLSYQKFESVLAAILPSAFGFCLAALGNQSSALVGKGLKHRGSDLAFFKSYLRKIFSRTYL